MDYGAALAKMLHLCLTLCDPIDGSPAGSAIPGILQARILEWVAISFSNAWKWKVKVKSLSHVWLFVTPWTAAHQAHLSMGFSRQDYWSGLPLPSPPWTIQSMKFSRPEYWSGYPFPSPGDLLNPGIEPRSPALQADSLPAEPQGKPKNTGVDSLSLLQQIFLTQELNWDLLHCRQILYQPSFLQNDSSEDIAFNLERSTEHVPFYKLCFSVWKNAYMACHLIVLLEVWDYGCILNSNPAKSLE